jgi:hypothetical protein
MMMVGYSPLSFVCRDCGYLGICLSEKDEASSMRNLRKVNIPAARKARIMLPFALVHHSPGSPERGRYS